jgi:hypothetical protein
MTHLLWWKMRVRCIHALKDLWLWLVTRIGLNRASIHCCLGSVFLFLGHGMLAERPIIWRTHVVLLLLLWVLYTRL